jgi:hypothetical protein
MPKSDETASQFMSIGTGGSTSESHSYEIDVCYPQNAKVPGHDLSGGTKTPGVGVDYNPIPEVKNPRSVSDQNPKYDAQGK